MDGRWNHLRDVAGVSVILGTAVLPGSSSLFRWAYFDGRQNYLRDVAGLGRVPKVFGLNCYALTKVAEPLASGYVKSIQAPEAQGEALLIPDPNPLP